MNLFQGPLYTGEMKICIPLMEEQPDQLVAELEKILSFQPDVVEWRVDGYRGSQPIEEVLETLLSSLGETPLIFTWRTQQEGGHEISFSQYRELIHLAADHQVAYVDVELVFGESIFISDKETLIQQGTKLLGSYHNFEKTPSSQELNHIFYQMHQLGADAFKVAVMPQHPGDVLTLLSACYENSLIYRDTPLIGISMGELGRISRIIGGLYGSRMTFGMIGKPSGPGQLSILELRKQMVVLTQKELEP